MEQTLVAVVKLALDLGIRARAEPKDKVMSDKELLDLLNRLSSNESFSVRNHDGADSARQS